MAISEAAACLLGHVTLWTPPTPPLNVLPSRLLWQLPLLLYLLTRPQALPPPLTARYLHPASRPHTPDAPAQPGSHPPHRTGSAPPQTPEDPRPFPEASAPCLTPQGRPTFPGGFWPLRAREQVLSEVFWNLPLGKCGSGPAPRRGPGASRPEDTLLCPIESGHGILLS